MNTPLIHGTIRAVVRRRGPSLVIIVTLAVAIGAATVTYSILDMFWHALPVPDDGRVAFIASTDPRPSQSQAGVYGGLAWTGVSIPDLADFTARTRSFEQFAGFAFGTATLTGVAEPERLRVARVTVNLLDAWRIAPQGGRGFLPSEGAPGGPGVVMLSDRLWTDRFGRSPGAIGHQLTIDGQSHTVIGVLPPSMSNGMFLGTDVALPLHMDPLRSARDERRLFLTGVLRHGITRDRARAELEAVVRQLQREYPATNAHTGVVVRPLVEMLGGTAPVLILFLAVVALSLIALACANIANIVLAVGASRRQEFAMRRSLGASRSTLMAQIVAEAVLLAAAACPLALLLSQAALKGLRWFDPGGASPLSAIVFNPRVAVAAIVMSVATALAFAILPAVRSMRESSGELSANWRTTGGTRQRRVFSHVLVAIQVGIAVVLCVQITSFARAARKFISAERGFDEQSLLTFRVDLTPSTYATDDAVTQFADGLLTRTSSIPAIASASIINRMPIGDRELGTRMAIEGTQLRPADRLPVTLAAITGQYLRTMRIPLLRGRGLTDDDVARRRRVALVSRMAARRYWSGRDPIGTRIEVDAVPGGAVEIVGIAGDVRNSDVDQGPAAQIYVPFTLQPSRAMAVVVRTSDGDPARIASAIRHEMAALDDTQAVFDLRPMSTVLFEDNAGSILVATVLGVIGLVAVCLAAAGVYGLVSYTVAQRTREIGIRMAVGAAPGVVVRMVLAQGARPVAAGAVIGMMGAFALGLMASAAMNDVDFRNPSTYAGVVVALVAVALASSYVPARRAARVDPMVTLKAE